MKASVIVPTYERSHFLPNLIQIFKNQTYEDKELLIHDDSPNKAEDIIKLIESEPNIKYIHCPPRLTLGEKLNILIEEASGDVIVQFDDDDYYAPIYIEKMIEYLGRYDFFKLSSWFGYGVKQNFFGYWHTNEVGGFNYNICPNTEYNIFPGFAQKQLDSFIWGYGFCYVFKKEIYPTVKCAAMNHGVDYDFILKLRKEGFTMKELPDKIGLCMHIVHATNTSRMFPNYRIPEFLIPAIFGEDILNYGYFKPFLF